MSRGRPRSAAAVVLAGAVLTACGGGSDAPAAVSSAVSSSVSSSAAGTSARAPSETASTAEPTASASSGQAAVLDWPTYHRDGMRSGYVRDGVTPRKLRAAWRADLDGAVYGQPLVLGDLVVAATENNTVYGLARATGAVRWKAHVSDPVPRSDLPCGNIDPLGITGTPAYDATTGWVYAVAETVGGHHTLVGVDVHNGQIVLRRDLPTPGGDQIATQQRPALLVTGGKVYVAFGGLYGDCGNYRGSVVAASASGSGPLLSYTVPTRRMGAIWATGGPTLSQDGQTVLVSVGNGAATGGAYDGSDSVVALGLGLDRRGFFAPSGWAQDNARDLDLGSSSPAVLPNGRVVIAGKRGVAYLLRADVLGGVGGAITSAEVCRAFGGPSHVGTVVYLPCASGGTAAVDTAGDRLHVLWRGPSGADGSPVVTGNTVWVPDVGAGTLYALSRTDGSVQAKVDVGARLPHFASPTPSGDLVLLGTMDGVVAVGVG